jgi:(p)ppGpp synthase/HD superfamily hydrolase
MLSPRFVEALIYAVQLHKDQVRKGTKIPYISHLLGVTSLVLEGGGSEDEAIAALLHDAVEDQGGLDTLEEIRITFGEQVANIVDACTDAYVIPKPPWRQRKEIHIQNLRDELPGSSVRLVSLADKLYNARSILIDLRENGNQIWDKFNGGKEGTIWYYTKLVEVFREKDSNSLIDEFERVVTEIQKFAKS